jgi:hypothetical protein
MIQKVFLVAAIGFLAVNAVATQPAELPPLKKTTLFANIASGCAEVDLKTWSHPIRTVLKKNRVKLLRVALCNAKIYPILFVSFPYDPMGPTDSYFSPLYQQMRVANHNRSFSFVAESDSTVVYIDYNSHGIASASYEPFEPGPAVEFQVNH